jgi:hypothetical protein
LQHVSGRDHRHRAPVQGVMAQADIKLSSDWITARTLIPRATD